MNCPKCKAEVPDASQFCPQCGRPQTENAEALARYKTPPWAFVLIIISLGLLVYVIGHSYYDAQRAIKPRAGAASPTTQPVPPQPPPPQPHLIPITNGALTVNASSYVWYTFTVPANVSTVTVTGHFTATGGSGNDIVVYILDEDGFVNFKNGHSTRTFYNSGKVTQAAIGAVLPSFPTTYYVVFDNRFSVMTPKAVQVSATLGYMQ